MGTSIFTAANISDNVEDYINSNISQKKIVMKNIRKNLKKASKNNKIIAAWSSTMLVNHYYRNHEEWAMFQDVVEIPLRKMGMDIRGYDKKRRVLYNIGRNL